MTVMYPLSPMKDDYIELRYSLRSVERWVPDVTEVVIVGEVIPDWLTGVVWVKVADIPGRKQLSIKRKIIAALRYLEARDILSMMFMNDDVYLLRPFESHFVFSGDLKHIGESGARPLRNELLSMNRETKNFDTHSPIMYATCFIDIMEKFTSDTIIKSAYANYLGIEGINRPDSKINQPIDVTEIRRFISNRPDFSTGPKGVKSIVPVLEELFPEPSKYEIV